MLYILYHILFIYYSSSGFCDTTIQSSVAFAPTVSILGFGSGSSNDTTASSVLDGFTALFSGLRRNNCSAYDYSVEAASGGDSKNFFHIKIAYTSSAGGILLLKSRPNGGPVINGISDPEIFHLGLGSDRIGYKIRCYAVHYSRSGTITTTLPIGSYILHNVGYLVKSGKPNTIVNANFLVELPQAHVENSPQFHPSNGGYCNLKKNLHSDFIDQIEVVFLLAP